MFRSLPRIFAFVILLLLTLAWLASLPIAPLLTQPASRVLPAEQSLIARAAAPADWRDTLILRVAISGVALQQVRGRVVWTQGTSGQGWLPLTVRADGQPHQLILPVGAHPEWRGVVQYVRLEFPQQAELRIQVTQAQLVRRLPSALDALLMLAVAPYLPTYPAWSYALLLVAAALGGGLALAWPAAGWRQRLAVVGLVLGGVTAVIAVSSQLALTRVVVERYGQLDEQAAREQAPALVYGESSRVNAALVAAASRLPDGPILLINRSLDSYLVYRAIYLLYPRQVDTIDELALSSMRPRELAHYVGVIQQRNSSRPPLPGWERVSGPSATLSIWRAPGMAPLALSSVGSAALLRLIAALGLVLVLGWSLAGLCGWQAGERLASAWPIGVSVAAGWMFCLAALGIGLAWWNVAPPLLIGALLLIRRDWLVWREAPPLVPRVPVGALWQIAGLLLILLIVANASVQAVLLPFLDQDTWKAWGLKGQAFYLDGTLNRVLTMYRTIPFHHSSYPPAQPLIQAWGYLAMGGISERLVKLVFPIWYAACIGLTWLACRQWQRGPTALAWTLLLATTPLLLDHATLANADLPLTVGLLLGAIALYRWIETGERRWLIGALVALGGAAWIKLDGTYLGAGMIGLATFIRARLMRRPRALPWQVILTGALALGLFVAIIAPWYLFTQSLGLASDIPDTDTVQRAGGTLAWKAITVIVGEVLFSYNNSAGGLLGGGYGALWIICAGGLLAGWRRLRVDPVLQFLVLLTVGIGTFYFLIYILHPFFSIERYLMHAAPLVVLAAARSTRTREDSTM